MGILTFSHPHCSSSGIVTPVYYKIARVPYETMMQYVETDANSRNSWCLAHFQCKNYGKKCCCPPKIPTFNRLKQRKFVYLIAGMIRHEEYCQSYPKMQNRAFLQMRNIQAMLGTITGKITDSIYQKGDQLFRFGPCKSSKCDQTGHCTKERMKPPLEATGVEVCRLCEDLLGIEFDWHKREDPAQTMHGIAAIYTDRALKKEDFRRIIHEI